VIKEVNDIIGKLILKPI